MRLHSGAAPLRCRFCPKKFTSSYKRQYHIDQTHFPSKMVHRLAKRAQIRQREREVLDQETEKGTSTSQQFRPNVASISNNNPIEHSSTTSIPNISMPIIENNRDYTLPPFGQNYVNPQPEQFEAHSVNVDCNNQTARHFSLTLTAGDVTVDGTTTTTANDVTLRMNMISYLKYGDSQYYKYWYADDLVLKFTVDGDSYEYPITNGYIAAPQDKSYACQNPDIWPMQPHKTGDMNKKAYDASLSFTNLQVDVNFVFNNTGPIDRNWFSDGVDCDDRLGKGGVVGLAFVFLVLLIGLYLLTLLSTAQNPVFGDKQIVVAQE